MFDINSFTADTFKALFSRDFPYLPYYNPNQTYFKDDIVFDDNNFYISLVDNNTAVPTNTTNWKVYKDSIDNYITDTDIQKAITEARINFNPNLFGKNCEIIKTVFAYLVAHFLVIDLNNAMNPLALGYSGITTSKSVGSVSESYAIPKWITDDSHLSMYTQTGYGRKYLTLILPYLTGNIIFTRGFISFA